MKKNIDFDEVAQLYDTYVQSDFDLKFWKDEIGLPSGYVLELMCGTGRISIPLIKQGVKLYGLDYSKELLNKFQEKVNKSKIKVKLIHGDARNFNIREKFAYIFIGCHSLSEILDNNEKLLLLKSVKKHLSDDGIFLFSLYNPEFRIEQLEKNKIISSEYNYGDEGKTLYFHFKLLSLDKKTNIVKAEQEYHICKNGETLKRFSMNIMFHLITKSEIELLLSLAGFKICTIFGDYQKNSYNSKSNFMIYRCQSIQS